VNRAEEELLKIIADKMAENGGLLPETVRLNLHHYDELTEKGEIKDGFLWALKLLESAPLATSKIKKGLNAPFSYFSALLLLGSDFVLLTSSTRPRSTSLSACSPSSETFSPWVSGFVLPSSTA
jgi:hypothetical protein